MAGSPGDHRPTIQLPLRDQLAFMKLVDAETHRAERRLLDSCARPGDMGPHAEHLLTETFRLMWRTPPDKEPSP
jgi:hypothetical protein